MEQGFQNQSELGWNPNYDLCDLRQVSSPLWASISACEKWASGSWGLLGHYENEVRWGLKSAQPFHGVSQNPQTLPVMLPWNRALVRIKQNHECKSTLKSTEQLLEITFWSWGLGRGRSPLRRGPRQGTPEQEDTQDQRKPLQCRTSDFSGLQDDF